MLSQSCHSEMNRDESGDMQASPARVNSRSHKSGMYVCIKVHCTTSTV